MEKPSVGRIVHYSSSTGDKCVAAIVTIVHPDYLSYHNDELVGTKSDHVNLAVFYPKGGFANRENVGPCHEKDKPAFTWHWPERTGGIVSSPVVLGVDGVEHVIPLKGR